MDTLTETKAVALINKQFFADVVKGLQSFPKTLQSKYFYDKNGDKLFQQIMASPEYYLTDCEMEILAEQSGGIATILKQKKVPFDLIELGAGDATKSIHLLRKLVNDLADFHYLPIDISTNVIDHLENYLPDQIPELNIKGFIGDYFEMLEKAVDFSERRKVVLFMGANIGNMMPNEAKMFCDKLKSYLRKDDILIIGFDLKKNPNKILAAYNDAAGITKRFNLNLLKRINAELSADFILENFEHYATYDPKSGACKSYLISLKEQMVKVGKTIIHFEKDEFIDMEISQKYSEREITELMVKSGYKPLKNFYDSRHYYVDSIWSVE